MMKNAQDWMIFKNKRIDFHLTNFKQGDYVDIFGIMGFVFGTMGFTFGLTAFTTALTSSNKVKELEKRIDDL